MSVWVCEYVGWNRANAVDKAFFLSHTHAPTYPRTNPLSRAGAFNLRFESPECPFLLRPGVRTVRTDQERIVRAIMGADRGGIYLAQHEDRA